MPSRCYKSFTTTKNITERGINMNEQLCLAAYVPFSQLPARVRSEVEERFYYLKADEPHDDYNLECFVRKEPSGYTVEASRYYEPGEPPETEIIYLSLTAAESAALDLLIIPRICAALMRSRQI